MLVTDAMPCVGGEETRFTLQGRPIVARDGACFDAQGVLAGSTLDMAQAVANTHRLLGVDLDEALMMASAAPAAFMGLAAERGAIRPAFVADLVALNEDLTVWATWIGGAMRGGD
jgi:N-acetylglucosamine-6-phosphate deacetylase